MLSEANKGTSILPNASQQQFCGSIDLREGLKSFQFGKKPRFDLSRSEMVKSRDLRDLEQVRSKRHNLSLRRCFYYSFHAVIILQKAEKVHQDGEGETPSVGHTYPHEDFLGENIFDI